LWVGRGCRDIAHTQGFRNDVLAVLRLHAPHIGATALPVESISGDALASGKPAVSATASRGEAGIAVTVVNAHHERPAQVCLAGCNESHRVR